MASGGYGLNHLCSSCPAVTSCSFAISSLLERVRWAEIGRGAVQSIVVNCSVYDQLRNSPPLEKGSKVEVEYRGQMCPGAVISTHTSDDYLEIALDTGEVLMAHMKQDKVRVL